MANNADNIQMMRPMVDGVAYVASKGTALPASATAALTSFNSIGYVSEDGVELTINRTKQELKDMSGSVCVTIQSEHSVQVKLKPLEWNDLVKKELFGDGNVDASGNVKINAVEIEEKPFVFDMRGRGGKLIRVCVPRMRLNTHDAIVFKSSGALAAGITYDCLPDSNGNNAYIYEAEAQ